MATTPHSPPTPPPWARADSIGYPAWQRFSHPGISVGTTALLATGGGATAVHDRHMSFIDSLAVRPGANGGVDADDPRVFRSAARAGTAARYGTALRSPPRAAVVHGAVPQALRTPYAPAAQVAPDGAVGGVVGEAAPAARNFELVMRREGGAMDAADATTATQGEVAQGAVGQTTAVQTAAVQTAAKATPAGASTTAFDSPVASISTAGIDRSVADLRSDGRAGPLLSVAASTPVAVVVAATSTATASASATEVPVALSPAVENPPDKTLAPGHGALVSAPGASPPQSLVSAADSKPAAVVSPTTPLAFTAASSPAPKSPVARVHRAAAARNSGGEGAAMPTASPFAFPGGGATDPAMPDLPAHGAAEPVGLLPATIVPASGSIPLPATSAPAPVNVTNPVALPAAMGRSAPALAAPVSGRETRLDLAALPLVTARAAPLIDHITMPLAAHMHMHMHMHTQTLRPSHGGSAPPLDRSVGPNPIERASAAAEVSTDVAATPAGRSADLPFIPLSTADAAASSMPVAEPPKAAPLGVLSSSAMTPGVIEPAAGLPRAATATGAARIDAPPALSAPSVPLLVHRRASPYAKSLPGEALTPASRAAGTAPAIARRFGTGSASPGTSTGAPLRFGRHDALVIAPSPMAGGMRPGGTAGLVLAPPKNSLVGRRTLLADAVERAYQHPIGAVPAATPASVAPLQACAADAPAAVLAQTGDTPQAAQLDRQFDVSTTLAHPPAQPTVMGMPLAHPRSGAQGIVVAATTAKASLVPLAVSAAYGPGAPVSSVTSVTLVAPVAPRQVASRAVAAVPSASAAGGTAAAASFASSAPPMLGSLTVPVAIASSTMRAPDMTLLQSRSTAGPAPDAASFDIAHAAAPRPPAIGGLPIVRADAASFDIARAAAPLPPASGEPPIVLADAGAGGSAPELVHRAVGAPSKVDAAGSGRPGATANTDAVPTGPAGPGIPIVLTQPLAGAAPLAMTQRQWWSDAPNLGVSGARAATLSRAPSMPLSLPQIARAAFEATDLGGMDPGGAPASPTPGAASSLATPQPRVVAMPLARRTAVNAPAAPIDRAAPPISFAAAHTVSPLADLLMPTSAPSPSPSSLPTAAGGPGHGAAPAEIDVDDIVERACRAVLARLAVDQERRGFARWA